MKETIKITAAFTAGAIIFGAAGVFAGQYTATDNPYPIKLDGNDVEIEGYNINDNTYFKLRDIASVVGGFSVDFEDDTIVLSTDTETEDSSDSESWDDSDYSEDEAEAPFTDEEVDAARSVIEEYYRAGNEKDRDAELATLTDRFYGDNVVLASDTESYITLTDIRYDPYDTEREAYVTSGNGSENGTALEDVIVFHIDFTVDFPEGTTDEEKGAWSSDSYEDWNLILVRDGSDGSWKIDDMGY